jgi:hypothetical protein
MQNHAFRIPKFLKPCGFGATFLKMNTHPLFQTAVRETLLALTLSLAVFAMPKRASAQNEIGFVERFALAEDREAVLQELIPGTEDYYYFHALHFQVQGKREQFAAILEQWRQRFPGSGRLKPLEDRQALLDYPIDPANTLD